MSASKEARQDLTQTKLIQEFKKRMRPVNKMI